jgi:hypothetical protein
MSGVVPGLLLSRMGEWLTRESAANNIGSGREVGSFDISYISQYRNFGPVMPKHRLAIRIIFHETTRLKEIGGFKTQRKATDTGKQIQSREGHPDIRPTISKKYSSPILLSQILFHRGGIFLNICFSFTIAR